MCSGSACYGNPSCINQATINAGDGYWGCSNIYCYTGCGISKCSSMCYTECIGLATS